MEWAKENPAKGRVSRLLVGRVALFPLRGEALLEIEFDSRFLLGKSPRISWLTDLNGLPSHVEANSSQDLAPHTPGEGLVAFFFYALIHPISGAQPAVLCQVGAQSLQVLVRCWPCCIAAA